MAKSLNKVTLIGNLGQDPEVRTTNNGGKVATLSIATSRQWKDSSGQTQEKTQWHRVVCWNAKTGQQLADLVEKFAKKGTRLYVEGEIEYRSWQDKEGQQRYTTEINCRDIILLGGGGEGGSGGGNEGRRSAAKPAASKTESAEDFPQELDAEDEDLPF